MTFEQIQAVIANCSFPEYSFRVWVDGRGEMYLQASYFETDTVTGKLEEQKTRRWFLSPEMTRSEVVQTAFKCIITSKEHSTREWFKYMDAPVFSPHYDIDALVDLCEQKRFDTRRT